MASTGRVPNPPFELPATVTVLFQFKENVIIAHNLDFDLASSGRTLEEATACIKACTKAYVEYGLEQGLEDHIYQSAPEEYWELARNAEALGSSEVILINDKRDSQESEPVRIGITPRTSGFIPIAA